MKPCIQTNCLPDRGVRAALLAIERAGCMAVELSSDSSRNHMYEVMALPKEEQLFTWGSCVCVSGGWVDFARNDIDRVYGQIELTRKLSAKRLRVWISNPRKDIQPNPGYYTDAVSNAVMLASAYKDVDFIFENHGGLLGTPEQCLLFLNMVKMPNVGLLLDPANFVVSGADPVRAVRMLQEETNWIRHVHVKDQDSTGFRLLGEGTVPWKDIFQALKDVKYEGYCSLEHAVGPDYEESMKTSWSRLLELTR
jgi:sugar phosphate isomerase/epimerase